ncbi:uncharacterized protein LOC129920632 [Episyrphus balteatus]|uniref:uncharacterized protein LOC129920632 n=1 Tax=Episyrphus balteatus TaxID=286459 RepID=UPI00248699DB|nr:uncharacterized protein LOC129920632 [Episyrphus balteatus]
MLYAFLMAKKAKLNFNKFHSANNHNQLFNVPKTVVKHKNDDLQKFIQFEINNNKFETILVNNKPHPSSCVETAVPSGFKPLLSSTPKQTEKSFEIIAKPVTKSTPNRRPLKMSQFLGDIYSSTENGDDPKSSDRHQYQDSDTVAVNDSISFEAHLKKFHLLLNPSALPIPNSNSTKSILLDSSPTIYNKRQKRYHDENFQIIENYVKIHASMKTTETRHDLATFKEAISNLANGTIEKDLSQVYHKQKKAPVFKVPVVPAKFYKIITEDSLDISQHLNTNEKHGHKGIRVDWNTQNENGFYQNKVITSKQHANQIKKNRNHRNEILSDLNFKTCGPTQKSIRYEKEITKFLDITKDSRVCDLSISQSFELCRDLDSYFSINKNPNEEETLF